MLKSITNEECTQSHGGTALQMQLPEPSNAKRKFIAALARKTLLQAPAWNFKIASQPEGLNPGRSKPILQ